MKSTGGTLRYRRLRAPREHGQALIDPPLADVAERIQSNIAVLQHDYDFHGCSWTALRQQARSEVLDAALQYSRAYRDVDLPTSHDLPLALSGHQPQLFHTGVWFKNFALASLTERGLATAIHLLIDNDTLVSPSLRVPTGSISEPRLESIPVDSVGQGVPWEDRQVVDRELFESFGQRVTDAIQPFVSQPLIQQVWPFAIEAMRSGENLGACLSHARHRLEESWGLNTLELPLSKVCELESFHRFTRHLLTRFSSIAV